MPCRTRPAVDLADGAHAGPRVPLRGALRLYIVRHGQTDHNLKAIIQGHLDTPLNDTGRHQAELAAKGLKDVRFQSAFSSDSDRAQSTAGVILAQQAKVELQSTELLRERDMGDLTGKKWPVTRSQGDGIRSETIETSESVRARLETFLKESILPLVPVSGERNVLITSHGGTISALVQSLVAPNGSFRYKCSPLVPRPLGSCWNTSITQVLIWQHRDQLQGEVISWADARHLEVAGEADRIEVTDALAI